MLLDTLLDDVTPRPRRIQLGRQWSTVVWTATAQFPPAAKNAMFECLVEISTKAFGADMTDYWAARDAGGFFERITTFCMLVDPLDAVVGWTGCHRTRFGGVSCLYLDSSGVLPQIQGAGLVGQLQIRLIVQECLARAPRPVHLVARTESPVVYRLLRNGCGERNIWPGPDGYVHPRAVAIGADAAEWLGQREKFDPGTLTVRGAYDNLEALYGDLPSCGEADVDSFFGTSLRPEDAFIVVARASVPQVLNAWASRRLRSLGRANRARG